MTNKVTIKDEEYLLKKYKEDRNQNPLGQLYNQYLHLVYGLCLKYLKNREEAKDAVMSIYEKISKELLSKEVTHFKSWLYMVSKNHCLMELRKKSPEENIEVFMEIPQDVHLYNEKVELESDLNSLEECIEELKSEQQKCVQLFFLQKKSYAQVCESTKLEMIKVKSHIQNGKRNLKNCLEAKNVSR